MTCFMIHQKTEWAPKHFANSTCFCDISLLLQTMTHIVLLYIATAALLPSNVASFSNVAAQLIVVHLGSCKHESEPHQSELH